MYGIMKGNEILSSVIATKLEWRELNERNIHKINSKYKEFLFSNFQKNINHNTVFLLIIKKCKKK